jgi:ABC-type multidrug transport system fused ATPase/permease subunit
VTGNAVSITAAMRIQTQRLGPLLRAQRGWFLWGLLFVFLTIGLTLVYPQVIRIIIDEGIQQGNTDLINSWVLVLVAILIVEAPSVFLRTYFFDVGARKAAIQLQDRLLRCLLSQEIGFFDKENIGELNARLMGDTHQLSQLVAYWIPEGLRFLLYGVFGIAFMIYTSPLLTLLVLVVGPPVAVGTAVLGRKIQKRQAASAHASAAAASTVLESFMGIRTVRAYDQEATERRRFSEKLRTLFVAGNRQTKVSAVLEGVTTLASESGVVFAIWAGGTLVVTGVLTPGALISFIFYTGLVVRSCRNVSKFAAEVMRSYGATERIFELMARESRMPSEGGLRPECAEGRLQLENVSFRYPTRPDSEILSGVSLEVSPGEFLALVGASGSGKSTITNLAARLYDPNQGRLLLDGIDLRELDPRWLRTQVTLVSQDSSLFSRSIEENVRYGSEDASAEEIDEALRVSNALEFVERLPDGLGTHVGDRGVVLSGGQRQRLAIARAVLRRSRVLILDEATSALDSESEMLVKEALHKLPHRPTVIIVAHRLSTVVDADRVLVIERGRVVANGTHSELIRESSVYRDLVETQLVRD